MICSERNRTFFQGSGNASKFEAIHVNINHALAYVHKTGNNNFLFLNNASNAPRNSPSVLVFGLEP